VSATWVPWQKYVRMDRGRWYFLSSELGRKARRWRRVEWGTVKPWLKAWVDLRIDQHADVTTLAQWGDVVTLGQLKKTAL
jgi:hypothetical protein